MTELDREDDETKDEFYMSLLEGTTVEEGTPLYYRCLRAAERHVLKLLKQIELEKEKTKRDR
jgi:hypothetical protein